MEEVPDFVANLSSSVQEDKAEIASSSATISAIVDILQNIANASSTNEVTEAVMQVGYPPSPISKDYVCYVNTCILMKCLLICRMYWKLLMSSLGMIRKNPGQF